MGKNVAERGHCRRPISQH